MSISTTADSETELQVYLENYSDACEDFWDLMQFWQDSAEIPNEVALQVLLQETVAYCKMGGLDKEAVIQLFNDIAIQYDSVPVSQNIAKGSEIEIALLNMLDNPKKKSNAPWMNNKKTKK